MATPTYALSVALCRALMLLWYPCILLPTPLSPQKDSDFHQTRREISGFHAVPFSFICLAIRTLVSEIFGWIFLTLIGSALPWCVFAHFTYSLLVKNPLSLTDRLIFIFALCSLYGPFWPEISWSATAHLLTHWITVSSSLICTVTSRHQWLIPRYVFYWLR
jgi:hypothetical protein